MCRKFQIARKLAEANAVYIEAWRESKQDSCLAIVLKSSTYTMLVGETFIALVNTEPVLVIAGSIYNAQVAA